MMKKYGFTLIELLAVIVILSIIVLIASPIILNVIDESRDKAMIVDTKFKLDLGGFGKDYSNLNDGTSNTYPQKTNDGEVSAKVGLPSWGNIYTGNDIDTSYWLINRYNLNTNSANATINSSSNGYGDTAGAIWYNVRPVLSIKSSVKIDSGKGTMAEPYKLVS